GLDHPLAAVPRPRRLADAALGVERPGPDQADRRVHADQLRARGVDRLLLEFELHAVLAADELLVLGPLVAGPGLRLAGFALPGPDQPGEVVDLRRRGGGVAPLLQQRDEPAAVLADVQRRVAAGVRRLVARGDRERALLDGRVLADEPDLVDIRLNLHFLAL